MLLAILSFVMLPNLYSQDKASVINEMKGIDEQFNAQMEGAEEEDAEKDKLKLFGDIRLRAEQDWDSRRFNGEFRDDRFRLRYRLRIGFSYKMSKHLSFGARLRSGVAESLQSPHNNLGHREFTGFPINIDKVYLDGKYGRRFRVFKRCSQY